MARMTGIDLYLDLLKKSLTATLHVPEPNHDNENASAFVVQFAMHYIRGAALTMLPGVRLDNLRHCLEAVVADGVPGDILEAGVWRGGACIFARGCLNALGQDDRAVWVADSFEGLPDPGDAHPHERAFHNSPMMQKMYGRMAASLEDVKANFAAYGILKENVHFLKGWFKDTLGDSRIKALSVLRVDGDYYDSVTQTLTALYDKVSPGGFVIIDDYGEDRWTACRKAVDDFRAGRGIADPLIMVDSKCASWRKSRG